MTKSRLLGISVVVLLALNIATVTMLMMGPGGHHGPKGKMQPKKVIIEKLKLDEAQTAAYALLIENHQKLVRQKEAERKTAKNAIFHLLASEDHSQKEALIANLGNVQQEIERIHFKHFADLKALCKPEQLPAYKELTNELGKLFAPPGRPKK